MKAFTISTFLTLLITKGYCQDTLPYYFQCLPCAPEYGSYTKLEFLDDSTAAFVGDFLETECFSDLKGILLLKNGEIIFTTQPSIPYYSEDYVISDIVKFDGRYIAAGSMGIQDISTWTNLDSLNIEVVGTNYFPDRINLAVDTTLNLLFWASGEIESVNGSVVNKSFGYYDGITAHLIDVPFSEIYGIDITVPEPGIVWLQPDGGSLLLYEYNYFTDTVILMENPLSVLPPYGAIFFEDFNDSSIYLYEVRYLTYESELAKYKNGIWSEPIVPWGIANIFQGPDDYVFVTGCFDYDCEIKFGTMDFPTLTPMVLKNSRIPWTTKGIFNSGQYYLYGYLEDEMDDCENFGKLVDTLITTSIEINNESFAIYPNPTGYGLTFELEGDPLANIKNISVINYFGELIKIIPTVETNYIDLSNIPSGVYILQITTTNNNYYKIFTKI